MKDFPEVAKKMVLNCRIDDLAYLQYGITDYDSVKALKTYSTDP